MNKKEWRKNRKANGLCYNCSNQSIPGRTLCEKCNFKNTEACRERTNNRKSQELCPRCGDHPSNDNIYCDRCLKLDSINRQTRLSCNMCSYCKKNEVVFDKTYCQDCANRRKAERQEKKINGICCETGCNEFAVHNKTKCVQCIAKIKLKYAKLRETVLNHYGMRCNCKCGCNVTNTKHLTIDHIKNDGAAHRRITGTGASFYRWVINNQFPDFLQILCWNCNCAKQYFGGCS